MRRSVVGHAAMVIAFVVTLAFFSSFAVVAGSQDSASDAREKREQVRREKADAAKELDAARADDAAVATALRDITDIVNAQQGVVDEANRQLELRRSEVLAAQAAVADAVDAEATLRNDLTQVAVAGFLNGGQQPSAFLQSDDLNEALRQNSLLEQANTDATELLEQLRTVQEDRVVSEAEAALAVADAERIEAELALKLADYEDQRQLQAELKAEMERRVAAWEAEVAAFQAEEAKLSEFIRQEEARLAPSGPSAAPAPGTPSVSGFQWPINARVSSGFGYRVHPIFGTKRLHKGIDLGASSGTPIAAAKAGTVISAGWRNGYGNTVVISHGGGISSLYAHQSRVAVSAGQEVARGDIIGYVGSTGWSTGPHLHFEIRANGVAVDPLPYLP